MSMYITLRLISFDKSICFIGYYRNTIFTHHRDIGKIRYIFPLKTSRFRNISIFVTFCIFIYDPFVQIIDSLSMDLGLTHHRSKCSWNWRTRGENVQKRRKKNWILHYIARLHTALIVRWFLAKNNMTVVPHPPCLSDSELRATFFSSPRWKFS